MQPKTIKNRVSSEVLGVIAGICVLLLTSCSKETNTPKKTSPKPQESVLSAPQNINAAPGDKQVFLTWAQVENANSYNLYIATTPNIIPRSIESLPNGRQQQFVHSPHIITKLDNGTTYYIVLTSANDSGESATSHELSVTPVSGEPLPAPPEFTQLTANATSIDVSWATTPGATQYHVHITHPDDVGVDLSGSTEKFVVQDTNYTISGLIRNKTYLIALTAENSAGVSDISEIINITTKPSVKKPTAPSGFTANSSDNSSITLNWNIAENVDQYTLVMSTDPNVSSINYQTLDNGKAIQSVAPLYHLTDLVPNTYYFVLSAKNESGISLDSRMISLKLETSKTVKPAKEEIAKKEIASIKVTLPFEKLGYGGDILNAQSNDYDSQPWSCVRHKKTGKIWEVKTLDDTFQSWQNTYPWKQADNKNNRCSEKICDAQDYVAKANRMRLCGFTNWRLPSLTELSSLLDKTQTYPTPKIDVRFFINTGGHYYWSNKSYQHNKKMAWFVYYASGYEYFDLISTPMHVRLVRDP